MAYDEELAARLRRRVEGLPGLSERRMMGGVCFFVNGNMIGGADRTKTGERRFMFRVGKHNEARAEALGGGEVVVQAGRRMSGLYFVDADGTPEETIAQWAALAVGHAAALPAK